MKSKTLNKVTLEKGERKIASTVGDYIRKRASKGKEVNNAALVAMLEVNGFKRVKDSEIRRIIHWLRVKGKFQWILANQKGYFYSESEEDLKVYLSTLKKKINSMREVARSFSYFDKDKS
jgi:hypothetical protein